MKNLTSREETIKGQASSVLMPMANWPPIGAIHVETSNYVAPLQLIYSTDNREILRVHIFVTGRVTTKSYLFSFDVVLMELITGCKRLSGISRKLDASGSNTWDMDMGFKKAPSNELLECSKDHIMNDVPGPNKRVDEVLPRDLGGRIENLLEVQKETDIPEYVGSKRLLGIDHRFKKQTKILDSEDSEEEKAISSSRRLISRRRLIGIYAGKEVEKGDVVAFRKRIRKFYVAHDIGARVVLHIFNRISFIIARGVRTYLQQQLFMSNPSLALRQQPSIISTMKVNTLLRKRHQQPCIRNTTSATDISEPSPASRYQQAVTRKPTSASRHQQAIRKLSH
ncbi:hypothetical protein Tco_0630642 [Tanacetum coccineum]